MNMNIAEIFTSLAGEGKYAGTPMTFVRLSGCNLNCSYCDTKYHREGKTMSTEEVASIINKSTAGVVCFTGGEPTLQLPAIMEVFWRTTGKHHHVETNGTYQGTGLRVFDYVSVSPKQLPFHTGGAVEYEVKVVTDGIGVGMELLDKADSLMPLTVGDPGVDADIRKRVWNLCVERNLRYSPRLHYEVWGWRRGV